MLQVTVARALPSDDVVLSVFDGGTVVFEKTCRSIFDDEFLDKDMTEISRGQEPSFIDILML